MNAYDDIIAREKQEALELFNAHMVFCRKKSEVMTEYVRRDDKGNTFVNADHHNRLHRAIRKCMKDRIPGIVIRWPPEYGKTQQLISLIIHILGRNTEEEYKDPHPMYRGAYISSSLGSAKKRLRTIKDLIETSEEVRTVWPKLKKATGVQELWTNEAINVERPSDIKLDDPSVQALGEGGDLLGSRLDWCIMDDTLTRNNTRTKEQRENHWDWIQTTVKTRMNEWGIIIVLCNSWHPEDAGYRLVNESGFALLEEPALDPSTKESIWPERWPTERVIEKIRSLGPIEGPRKMLHKARDESVMRFTPEMVGVALRKGAGHNLVTSYVPSDGTRVYTGLDFGGSKRKRKTAGRTTGQSCFFTWALLKSGVKMVLNIQTGRWGTAELARRAKDITQRFDSIIVAEDNATQGLIIEAMQILGSSVPIVPRTTSSDDFDPQFGLEKMGVEMLNGNIIIPCENESNMNPEVFEWIQELYDYIPGQHAGDRLMASYFGWDRMRTGSRKSGPLRHGLKIIGG